ncbi:MAG TPA: M1 family aminopeptidase, partial [Longimicrobiales bacterium]|nr:M1 family aminopeptidase [Longimicrobiales bacterium]
IVGQFMFFSADYAVHTERWNDVEIQAYIDPRHTQITERLLRSVRASLDYFSTEFGPYPYPFLQVIEQPAKGMGMGVDGSGVVTGLEGFFRLDPQDDDFDAVFQITAHEMAHQWWGTQLRYAPAEGAIVLSESLAWYSAMMVMRETNGADQLRRFMSHMREPMPWPAIRTGLPLLRAMDPWAGYRKGPYALYALAEYMGEQRVNGALASLLRTQAGRRATTLDLYRELQAVTPDTLQYLLHDLFAANTFWELDAVDATARQTAADAWEVTLRVRARKVVADSAGVETELAMDEWVPIGVFAEAPGNDELGAPLYLQMHRIRAGEQTITVTVPRAPLLAGIDPHHLLDWVEDGNDDNIEVVTITNERAAVTARRGTR